MAMGLRARMFRTCFDPCALFSCQVSCSVSSSTDVCASKRLGPTALKLFEFDHGKSGHNLGVDRVHNTWPKLLY